MDGLDSGGPQPFAAAVAGDSVLGGRRARTTPSYLPKPPSATRRALGDEDVLARIFYHLDGTSLTRVGLVDCTWRSVARNDSLWRHLVAAERLPPFNAPACLTPPTWAVERGPGVADGAAVDRSWRQAYRLLALWERGRPNAGQPAPRLAVSSALDAGAVAERATVDSAAQPLATLFGASVHLHVAAALGRPFREVGELFPAAPASRWQLAGSGPLVAAKNSRGAVYVIESGNRPLRAYALPLQQTGQLAAEVRVVMPASARAGDGKYHVEAEASVHCLTRSGLTWLSWDWRQGKVRTRLPGRFGKLVVVGRRECWLGWNDGKKDGGVGRFGLYDAQSGEMLLENRTYHKLSGCALLTPDRGPLVAWSPSLHLRIQWTTSPELAGLPENTSGQPMWGNRPARVSVEGGGGQRCSFGDQVLDMVADEAVAGRVRLHVGGVAAQDAGKQFWLEGLGQHLFTPKAARSSCLVPSRPAQLPVALLG